jgi:hypothetical protein
MALLTGFYVLLVGSATALSAGCYVLLVRSMVTTASLSAFAGDLALFGFIHRCESAVAFLVGHGIAPVMNRNVRLSTNEVTVKERESNEFEIPVRALSYRPPACLKNAAFFKLAWTRAQRALQ